MRNLLRRIYHRSLPLLDRLFPKTLGLGSGRGRLARDRLRVLEQAFMYTRNERVRGDYFEFGVARGRSLIMAFNSERRFHSEDGTTARFFGFDSFKGFPEPRGVDRIFERFKKGEQAHGSRTHVLRILSRHGVDLSRIRLVEGWYSDVLTPTLREELEVQGARVVNVDCDLYESTKYALEWVTPMVRDGTVILFDDWLCYRADPDKGEQRAAREWMRANPGLTLVPYRSYANVGQSFICVWREPYDNQEDPIPNRTPDTRARDRGEEK